MPTPTVVDQKRITRNTLMLYFRMGLMMLVGLYTSRVVLDALGETDYGIYSAVGGIVVMFSFLSNTMSTACQRFFSFELGRGDFEKLRMRFTQSLLVFAVIVAIVIILSEIGGTWYLEHKMQLSNRDKAAGIVFQCSVIGFAFQIMRTPYMGLIIAREKMKVFAYISFFEVFGTLAIALFLSHTEQDKLIVYAQLMLALQALTAFVFWLYCWIFYPECKLTKKVSGSFHEMFTFVSWELVGSFAGVCKSYGVNLLLNPFFGPVVNAARGIAQKVYMTIVQLQTNFFMAVKPQIIKSYATGAVKEMVNLLCQSTRLTYFLLLFIALPIILETPFLLDLWLKDVPEQSVIFTRLLLINGLIDTFSNPLASAIQATGKNKWYQICMGSTLMAILPVAYIGMKFFHWQAVSVFWVSIILSLAAQCVRTYFVHKQVNLHLPTFLRKVVFVIIAVTLLACSVPIILQWAMGSERGTFGSVMVMAISIISTAVVVYGIGLTKQERHKLREFIYQHIGKCKQ